VGPGTGHVSHCAVAVKNELPSLLPSLCSLCRGVFTTETQCPSKVEQGTSRCWKMQSNLMLDFLHEIMDAIISENFYLANRKSLN